MFAKILPFFAAAVVFLLSCSRESVEPLWEVQSHLNSKDYKGGLFPVWITLKEPMPEKNAAIEWKTGYSHIAYRTQAKDTIKKRVLADTAFLYWEKEPPPFLKLDSTRIEQDSEISWNVDTTYYYRDTIFAIVNGHESEPIVVEVKNILPRITSITVGSISQDGDSLLTIAANPGGRMDIFIHLEKPFNNSFRPKIEMPKKMGNNLRSKYQSDSLWIYEWTVPNEIITDSTQRLRITDTGGYGERLYKVNLVVYTEYGSFWMASENELVKYSPSGAEVARISNDTLSSISDIAINPINGKLYVCDKDGNSFSIYDAYGKRLFRDTKLFNYPTGVAIDVDGEYIWIADAKDKSATTLQARLQRFMFSDNSLQFTNVSYDVSGKIKGLSVDQFKKDFVWFTVEKGEIGFVSNSGLDPEPKYITYTWSRPSMVSYLNGVAWIADSSRIVAVDASSKVLARIRNFGFVSSISASSKGDVWVSDILTGKVYRFKGPFKGTTDDLNLTVLHGTTDAGTKFLAPTSISAFMEDGGAWVVDNGAGKAVRINNLGKAISSGTGLKSPILGKTIQKVE